MKRIGKHNEIVVLHIFVVFFSLLVLFAAVYENMSLPKIRRGFYTRNQISAYAPFEYERSNLLALCDEYSDLDFLISRTSLSLSMDLRGVYFSQSMETPPLVSGRFLTQEEMLSNEKLAVIGTDFLEEVYVEDGVQYIDISREAYEVVGVLGIGQASRLDSIVYIPLGELIEGATAMGLYELDSDTIATLEILSPLFNEALELPITGSLFTTTYLSYGSETSAAFALALSEIDNTTRICLALFFCIVLASLFFNAKWVRRAYALMRAERILGFHPLQIFCTVWSPYFLRACIGIALASAVYRYLSAVEVLLGVPLSWTLAAIAALCVCITIHIFVLVNIVLHQLEKG